MLTVVAESVFQSKMCMKSCLLAFDYLATDEKCLGSMGFDCFSVVEECVFVETSVSRVNAMAPLAELEHFEDDLREFTKQILADLKVTDYKIDITHGSAKGDGFLGAIFKITVTGSNSFKKSFIAKAAVKNDEIRKLVSVRNYFTAEILFYEQVLPALLEFQGKKRVKVPFDNVARCYKCVGGELCETLIFDDLKEMGYEQWVRKAILPEGYIEEVMKIYGRFHALSFALRDQEPEEFQRITGNMHDAMKEAVENFTDETRNTFPTLFGVYENYFAKNTEKNIVDRFRKFWTTWEDILSNTADNRDPQSVILHGDCWSGNFLFKKPVNGSNTPGVRFLDFQLQKLGSPVMDLTYFFFANATGEILRNFDVYMKIYHKSLVEQLTELGSSPELFTEDDLKRHISKYSKYGLIFAAMIIKILYSDTDEVPEMTNEEDLKAFGLEIKDQDKASQRLLDVVKFAVERDYI